MTFEVFLPESPANWLRAKLAAGVFSDAKETAFVAFQNLRELDDHPHLREQLAMHAAERALAGADGPLLGS
jgi:hypothetical protein